MINERIGAYFIDRPVVRHLFFYFILQKKIHFDREDKKKIMTHFPCKTEIRADEKIITEFSVDIESAESRGSKINQKYLKHPKCGYNEQIAFPHDAPNAFESAWFDPQTFEAGRANW